MEWCHYITRPGNGSSAVLRDLYDFAWIDTTYQIQEMVNFWKFGFAIHLHIYIFQVYLGITNEYVYNNLFKLWYTSTRQ